ncbi:MAG: dTMP kinase [Rickettsiales bacterium]|nr:MAG: dTMP kinase [Rickettsiales bacterium]
MDWNKLKGKFITFEGGEGVGKTTQSKKLVETIQQAGFDAEWTREPGGCPAAEKIRQVFLDNESNWDTMTEMLLAYSARRMHTEKKIKPAIEEGKIVISDRYLDSTTAYQGYADGLDTKIINLASKIVLGNFKPDLTIVLDMDVEDTLKRVEKRDGNNRFDEASKEFYNKIRHGFLDIAKKNKDRILVMDATDMNIDELHNKILDVLDKRF